MVVIGSTFFVTASLCGEIEDDLKELIKKNHQIGCHGLTHGDDENFAKLPYNEQLYRIEQATNILESFVGKVTAFMMLKNNSITDEIENFL